MILHPGHYNGVLHPWEHYLELAEDFSNVADVLEALNDIKSMQRMVDVTYKHINSQANLRFYKYVQQVDRIISYAFRSYTNKSAEHRKSPENSVVLSLNSSRNTLARIKTEKNSSDIIDLKEEINSQINESAKHLEEFAKFQSETKRDLNQLSLETVKAQAEIKETITVFQTKQARI